MEQIRKNIWIIVAVAVIIAGIFFWLSRGLQPNNSGTTATAPQQDSTKIYQFAAQAKNPIGSKLPETNPFESDKTNPLKNIYQNPF